MWKPVAAVVLPIWFGVTTTACAVSFRDIADGIANSKPTYTTKENVKVDESLAEFRKKQAQYCIERAADLNRRAVQNLVAELGLGITGYAAAGTATVAGSLAAAMNDSDSNKGTVEKVGVVAAGIGLALIAVREIFNWNQLSRVERVASEDLARSASSIVTTTSYEKAQEAFDQCVQTLHGVADDYPEPVPSTAPAAGGAGGAGGAASGH